MMKVVIIFCTTVVGLTLANGVYHQESSYQASSAHYRNNELQRSNDDKGFYSKDGDLAGRTRPKINAHDEHQEYVNPKLREGQQSANYNMGDSYGQLSTQPGYRHGEFGGGAGHNLFNTGGGYGASSGYQQGGSSSNFQSYGVQSNLRQVSQTVQDDLARELQRAISEQHRRTAQYSSHITQAQMEADKRALEEEMRRNVTMRMQEAVRSRYGNQAMDAGYSYSIQNGRLQPNANFNNQELVDLTNQMQGDLRRQLEEGMRSYYRTEVRQTTTTTHHNNGGYQPVVIEPRPYHPTPLRPEMHVVRPELRPFPDAFTQSVRYPPVVENPDSITTIATRVQHDLDEHLNKILDDTQRRYFSANSMHMNMNNFNYDTILNQLENDLRRNITFQFEKHLGRNYAQYGNYNSRYSIQDVENLKRQMEQNLISKLNRDFSNQRQRYFQTQSGGYTHMTSGGSHQVSTGGSHMATGGGYNQNQIYRPMGYYPSSDNYVASNIDTAEIQRRLQADLSRQLQDALMRHQYRQTHQYNAAYGNPQANYQVSLQQLTAEMNRNLTRQLEHSMSGYAQSGNYNAQYANLRNQLQDELQRQLQQGLQQSYSSHSSWSASSSSSSANANNNFRPVRAFDQGLYHTYGGSSDLHAMGDDCMLGDDPSAYQTRDTQQLEDLNQKLTHQEMQQQAEDDDQDLTQQVEDLTQQIEDQNEDLTQQVEDLNQKQIASQDLVQKVAKQQDLTQQIEDQSDLTQQIEDQSDLTQQVEDLTQQVQKSNDDLSSLSNTQQVVRPQKPLNMDYQPVYPRRHPYSSYGQHSTQQGAYGQNTRVVSEDQQHPYHQTTGNYSPALTSANRERTVRPLSYQPYSGQEIRPLSQATPTSTSTYQAKYNMPVSYQPYSGREIRPLDQATPTSTYTDRAKYNMPVSYQPYSGREIRPLDQATPTSTSTYRAKYNMPVSYQPYSGREIGSLDHATPTSPSTYRAKYNMPVSYRPYSGQELVDNDYYELQRKPQVGEQTLGQQVVANDFDLQKPQVDQQTLGQKLVDNNFGNPNELGQQTEDVGFGYLGNGNVGQQTANLEGLNQQEQLGQQTEDNDFGQLEIGSQQMGRQIQNFGQQAQDLGQQTENVGLGKYTGIGQQTEDIGQLEFGSQQMGRQIQNFGQQTQDLGQQTEDIGQLEIGSQQLGRQTANQYLGQQIEQVGKLEIGGYPVMPPQESVGQQVELEPFEIGTKPSESQPMSENYLGQNQQENLDMTQQVFDDDLTQQTEDINFGKFETGNPKAQIFQPLRIPQTEDSSSQKPIEFGQQTVVDDDDLTKQTVDDLTQQTIDPDQTGDLTQQSQISQHIEKLSQKLEDLTRDDAQQVEDAQIAQQSRFVPTRRPKLDGYGYPYQQYDVEQPVEPQVSDNKIFKTTEENPDSQVLLNQQQQQSLQDAERESQRLIELIRQQTQYKPRPVYAPVQIDDQRQDLQVGTTRNRPNQLDNGYKPAYQSKPTYSQVLTSDSQQRDAYRPYQFHYGNPRQVSVDDSSSDYMIHPVRATVPPKIAPQKIEDNQDTSQYNIYPVYGTVPPKIKPQKIEEATTVIPDTLEYSTQSQETEEDSNSNEEIAVKKPHNKVTITKTASEPETVEPKRLDENSETEGQTTTEEPSKWQRFKNAVKEKASNIRDKLG